MVLWLKIRSQLETLNKQQLVENSQMAKNVAKVVGVNRSEDFLVGSDWVHEKQFDLSQCIGLSPFEPMHSLKSNCVMV